MLKHKKNPVKKTSQIDSELKKLIIKKGSILLVVIIFIIAGYFYNEKNIAEYKKAQAKTKSLDSQLQERSRKFDEAEKALQVYLELNENKLPTESSYKFTYQRNQVLEPLIRDLQQKYEIKVFNYSNSQISVENSLATPIFTVSRSNIKMEIAGPPDEMVFAMLNEMQEKLPGFSYFGNIKLGRRIAINEANINRFFTDRRFSYSSAEIELVWLTLNKK